jgi:hypothetical protein
MRYILNNKRPLPLPMSTVERVARASFKNFTIHGLAGGGVPNQPRCEFIGDSAPSNSNLALVPGRRHDVQGRTDDKIGLACVSFGGHGERHVFPVVDYQFKNSLLEEITQMIYTSALKEMKDDDEALLGITEQDRFNGDLTSAWRAGEQGTGINKLTTLDQELVTAEVSRRVQDFLFQRREARRANVFWCAMEAYSHGRREMIQYLEDQPDSMFKSVRLSRAVIGVYSSGLFHWLERQALTTTSTLQPEHPPVQPPTMLQTAATTFNLGFADAVAVAEETITAMQASLTLRETAFSAYLQTVMASRPTSTTTRRLLKKFGRPKEILRRYAASQEEAHSAFSLFQDTQRA